MSRENLEMVRDGYETWKRTRALDFGLLHPDVEWTIHGTPAGTLTFHGRDEVAGWFADQDAAFADQWWEVEELREVPGGRVLAMVVARAVGRESGATVALPLANIWTIADGRVTRLEIFLDRRAAVEAAGG